MTSTPSKILLFSGKRKSGKDFITDQLISRLDKNSVALIKISGPIKSHWASTNGLKLDALLSADNYKESYRKEMIEWSEKVRSEDYGYFCRASIDMYSASAKPIWIVSDIRRKTDIKWFKEHYPCITTIRILADPSVRAQRGWTFTPGVDDVASECDLDDFTAWDHVVENNGKDDINVIIDSLTSLASI